MKLSFLTLILICFTTSVEAQTQFFVSNQGRTKSDGTIKRPYKNISDAIEKAYTVSSDTVEILLRKGRYDIDKTIEVNQHWKGKQLIIRSYNGEEVSKIGRAHV